MGIRARGARVGAGVEAAAKATAGVVEHVAYLDAVRRGLVSGRVDVIRCQDRAVHRARLG